MSSESEDEFQSADEGSDSENLECISKTLAQSTEPFVDGNCCERVCKIRGYETGMEEFDKNVSALKGPAIVEDTKTTNDKTKTCQEEVPFANPEKIVSVAVSQLSIVGETARERPSGQVLHSESGGSKVNEIAVMCVETVEGGNVTQECVEKKTSEYHLEEHTRVLEVDQAQSKEVVGINAEEPVASTLCKSERSSTIASIENTKPERVHDGSGLPEGRNPKAIKQSKIGMKKPREKLGERLGARKLISTSTDSTSFMNATSYTEEESGKLLPNDQRKPDAKTVGKSTDSTSCGDSVQVMGKESDKMQTINERCMIGKCVEENRWEEDEKCKKRQQWKEQQERWHRALNFDKDGKEVSPKDGNEWAAPWGGWGNTLLNAATTFTREVGRGMGTVMETVESSIGAPNPEVMAHEVVKQVQQGKVLKERSSISTAEEREEADKDNEAISEGRALDGWQSEQQTSTSYGLGGFSLGSLVSGVSGALETASSKVLMGGLDTLEVIGRKAMDVIQEGDPGLRRKRAFLSNTKPNLTQILQEARQSAAEEDRKRIIDGKSAKNSERPSFEQAWEDSEGPVHLEALSLVAKQCQSKRTSLAATLPHFMHDKLHSENDFIKSACEMDEEVQLDRDFVEVVPIALAQTGLPLHPQKLIEAWSSVEEKAALIQEAELENRDQAENELYGALAKLVTQLCALAHKGGELALITPEINPLDVATHFRELAQVVSGSLENMTDQVCGTITSEVAAADTQVKDTITNIYLQAATCNHYIQQSLVSLASILQYSNTKLATAQV